MVNNIKNSYLCDINDFIYDLIIIFKKISSNKMISFKKYF